MSLINDALKRANEAQKQPNREQSPVSEPQMRAVEAKKTSSVPVLALAVVAMVVGAVVLFWKASQTVSRPATVQTATPVAPAPAQPLPPESKKAIEPPVAPMVTKTETPVSAAVPTAAP